MKSSGSGRAGVGVGRGVTSGSGPSESVRFGALGLRCPGETSSSSIVFSLDGVDSASDDFLGPCKKPRERISVGYSWRGSSVGRLIWSGERGERGDSGLNMGSADEDEFSLEMLRLPSEPPRS